MSKTHNKRNRSRRSAKMPYWQHVPCPEWCNLGHADKDDPDDRRHFSNAPRVTLGEMPGERFTRGDGSQSFQAAEAEVFLEQGVREVEPVMCVSVNESKEALRMTLAEVEQLIETMRLMVQAAKRG